MLEARHSTNSVYRRLKNSMNARASVVLPTYNRSVPLIDVARSILEQPLRTSKLLVIDDASSGDIIHFLAGLGDDCIRFLRSYPIRGSAAARKAAVAVSRGELVACQSSYCLRSPGNLLRTDNNWLKRTLLDCRRGRAGRRDLLRSRASERQHTSQLGYSLVRRALSRTNRICIATGS